MKRKQIFNKFATKTSRKVVASALALSMALSGAVYAMTDNAVAKAEASEEEKPSAYALGDVDGNGKVELADAQLALKAALKIQPLDDLAFAAADIDGNDKVELVDAQAILKAALKIMPIPSREPVESAAPSKTPRPTPPPITQPTVKPKPILDMAEPKPENVVSAQSVEVKKFNGAHLGDDGKTIVLGDIPTQAGATANGVEMKNPFAGRKDLRQTVSDAIRVSGTAVKPTVWELTGASVEAQNNFDFSAADDRVYRGATNTGLPTAFSPNEVDYTIPEWKHGITVSFWAKANSQTHADPALVFENGNYTVAIRLNGTVRFEDGLDGENQLKMTSGEINADTSQWIYYTITIANDWIDVYANGKKNVYNTVEFSRKKISKFNDGFLTRYNPIGDITADDIAKDEKGWYTTADHDYVRGYYYTTMDSTEHCAWYYNKDLEQYMFHDNFGAFHNQRFRGASTGASLIMDLITDKKSKMWIAGGNSENGSEFARTLLRDTNISDVRVYEKELTPEEVAACYVYDTTTPEAITWDPSKVVEDVQEATQAGISIAEDGLSAWAKYDEEEDTITFIETDGEDEEPVGVQINNPFSKKTELVESLESALSGQAIFPFDVLDRERKGWGKYGVQVARGNFYDVYYGDPYKEGNEMNPQTGNGVDSIMTEAEVKAAYGNQVTTYQRPKWNSGATISFWAKPARVDDSPLLTFYSASKTNGMIMVMSVRGDICYYSMRTQEATDGSVAKDWTKGSVSSTGEPKNTFAALGDASYVKAGEWNYYTLTVANDWIQVYVNGKELVYAEVSLRRNDVKYFNKGYMTRYNTIGIRTKTQIDAMLEAEGHDGTGKTLEGTARNYILKSGQYYDFSLGTNPVNGESVYSDKGFNVSRDEASIRANGVYGNPYGHSGECPLLMENFTSNGVKMYFGGAPTKVGLDYTKPYNFNTLKVDPEEVGEPSEEEAEQVTPEAAEGVIEGITIAKNTELTKDSPVQYVTTRYSSPGTLNQKAHPNYMAKIFYSDHKLKEGTQIHGMVTHMKELTAEEVAEEFDNAVVPAAE